MAGFIGTWGPREEQLHPRGFHGRFIRKFNIPEILPRILKLMDAAFHPRSFGSQGQASQYLFNQGKPGRFGNGVDYRRLHFDFDEANAHLQQGDIDPSTQRYIDMMERNATTLPDDIITAQTFTPESLGMTPEQMNEPGGDFNGLIGSVIADRGYSAVHVGASPNHGPGRILLTIATPKGTRVIIPGRNRNDSGLFLDRDQPLLVTSVSPDGRGGWYMMAVAMPVADLQHGKTTGNVPNLAAPRGVGLTPEQREERIGAPQAPDQQAQRAGTPPPMGAGGQVTGQNVNAPEQPSPPAPAPAQAAPSPGAPPSPVGRGQPPPRNEPVHREAVGGTGGAEGKTAAEIANAPVGPAPGSSPESVAAPAPQAAPNEHVDRAREKARVKRDYRKMATSVPVADAMQEIEELSHKKQSNQTIAQHIRGIISDPSMEEVPKDERDRLKQSLEEAAAHFENNKPNQGRQRLASLGRELDLSPGDKPGSTVDYDPATMDSVADVPDGSQVEVIRPSVIHTDPDTGKETVISKGRVRPVGGAAPETGAPDRQGGVVPEAGPTAVAEVPGRTPAEDRVVNRAKGWRGHERNDEERRIVAHADEILAREGAAPAAPAPERAPRTGRAPMAKKAAVKEAAPAKKTPAKKAQKAVDILAERDAKKLEMAKRQGERERVAREKAAERTRLAEEKKAAAAKAKEERAAAKAAAPAKKAVKKAAPAKDLTPEQQAAAEVQARADEAGLPGSVAELRAAAKEQGIRGFSTMRKEQLQRALLGEDVSPTKASRFIMSPDRAVGHIQRMESRNEALALLKDHTIKDLRELAKHIDREDLSKPQKGLNKDRLKELLLDDIRNEDTNELRGRRPDHTLKEELQLGKHDGGIDFHTDDLEDRWAQGQVDGILKSAYGQELDPEELRSHRDQLEDVAQTLRGEGKRTDAALVQNVADVLGMRAQIISGEEEPAAPVKRAARKAAVPVKRVSRGVAKPGKLDISTLAREAGIPGDGGGIVPIRQADLNDGLSPAEVATKIRADAKSLEDSPLPKPRDEFDGKQGKKDRAAAVAQIRDLADRVEASSPAPAAAPAKGSIRDQAKDLGMTGADDHALDYFQQKLDGTNTVFKGNDLGRPLTRSEVADDIENFIDNPFTGLKQQRDDASKAGNTDKAVELQQRMDRMHALAERVRGRAPAKKAAPPAPKRPAAEVARATERAAKAVPPGSVPGPRAQAKVTNNERADAFRAAWDAAGIPDEPGRSASRTMAEIRDRVHSGDWSPEEGIRRLETDIDLNKLDVAEAEAVLRDENLDSEERKDLTGRLAKLHTDIQAEEKASKFMRRYFRQEPEITVEEAKAALDPEQRSWLDGADPEEVREGARQQGLGEVPGDTAEEVFENALKKVIERELGNRDAKKAAAAKKAAKKALPKAEPKVDPENPERLDVRQIGTGIDFKEEDKKLLDSIQQRLDAGESPAKIGESIDGSGAMSPRAQRKMLIDITDLDNRIQDAKQQKLPASQIRALEAERTRVRESMARMEAQAQRQEELGRRLRLMSNPTKKAAAPAAPATPAPAKPSKELSPLANGTRRKSMANVEVGDLVRGASGSQGERAIPKRVTNVEHVGRRMVITREDGLKFEGAPQTAVWLGEAGAPKALAPTKAARVGPGGSSFPADMPAEERARRLARIEARQAKKATTNPNLDGLSDDELRKILDSDQFPDAQKAQIRSELAARDAKKEARGAQARLLATAIDRLDSARTEAQVRDIVKGLTMPELKVLAGKYPLSNVGRSKESLIKALADFHTNRANFEVLTRGGHRGTPIQAGQFTDKPKLPNTYEERIRSDVFYHDDGPVGTAAERLGQDAQLNVDGDSLVNTVNKLATRSATGQISAEHMVQELRQLHDRLPPGPGKSAISHALETIDLPPVAPLPLPPGTPQPLVELMEMFSGMPLARFRRQHRPGERTLMEELQNIAQELAEKGGLRGGVDGALMQRLHNRFHESFEAEGKFEVDRAVQRVAERMAELRKEAARARRLAAEGQ